MAAKAALDQQDATAAAVRSSPDAISLDYLSIQATLNRIEASLAQGFASMAQNFAQVHTESMSIQCQVRLFLRYIVQL